MLDQSKTKPQQANVKSCSSMSGVKELNGPFYGPSFTASDINFFSQASYIPCLQLFSEGISWLWLLQNLRVTTVTQVSFSRLTQGPLTAASPFWAVAQGFPCHLLPGLSGSQKPQNKNPRPQPGGGGSRL